MNRFRPSPHRDWSFPRVCDPTQRSVPQFRSPDRRGTNIWRVMYKKNARHESPKSFCLPSDRPTARPCVRRVVWACSDASPERQGAYRQVERLPFRFEEVSIQESTVGAVRHAPSRARQLQHAAFLWKRHLLQSAFAKLRSPVARAASSRPGLCAPRSVRLRGLPPFDGASPLCSIERKLPNALTISG